jgi:competence protein ComEC
VSHLISISGLHVTVFATLVGGAATALLRRSTRLTTRVAAVKPGAAVGALAATVYVLLAGAEVPAVRTLLMLLVAAWGLWFGRPGTAGMVWLWALVAVLAWDPWAPLAAGFWLSFGAVGLLLYASVGRLRRPAAVGLRARVAATVREGTAAQWVVTLGLVPLSLLLFQQFSLVAPLANAIAIPVVTLAVVPLVLTGIVLPIDTLYQAAHAILAWLMVFLHTLAGLPGSAWEQHAPPWWTVGVAMLGILWLIAPRGVPGRALGFVALLPLSIVRPLPPVDGAFRLTVLDVGQGLASIVQTRSHTLVYDTGPRFTESADAGGRIVAPVLRAAGIARAGGLVVSHLDLDHSGGALSLLQTVPFDWVASSLPGDHPIPQRAAPTAQVLR